MIHNRFLLNPRTLAPPAFWKNQTPADLRGFWGWEGGLGESNFTVRIFKSNTVKVGWAVQPVFQVGLHKKDLDRGLRPSPARCAREGLLKKIKAFFDVGEIYHISAAPSHPSRMLGGQGCGGREKSCNYVVQNLISLNLIVNHFERYPLLTKKC